jgi:hypothetical protein
MNFETLNEFMEFKPINDFQKIKKRVTVLGRHSAHSRIRVTRSPRLGWPRRNGGGGVARSPAGGAQAATAWLWWAQAAVSHAARSLHQGRETRD